MANAVNAISCLMWLAKCGVAFLTLAAFMPIARGHESVGLTFHLEVKGRTCFFEDFKIVRAFIFSFQVLKGGLQDVDVTIESPNKKVLYTKSKAKKGLYAFESSWGRYSFCFGNEFSAVTHKIVYFEIRPEEHKPLAMEAGIKRPTANTQFEESMELIHKANTEMIYYQREYRLKEARGRFIAETLNKGVFWWSAGQSIIIFTIGMIQVLTLRWFFTEKRKSSKPDEDSQDRVFANPRSTI